MAATETGTTTTRKRNSHEVVEPNYVSNPSLSGIASAGDPPMDRRLFKAASTGDVTLLFHLVTEDPDRLFSVTPHGNNCLHIAAMLGHEKFVEEVCSYEKVSSLLLCTNINGETPLVAALMASNAPLASILIKIHLKAKSNGNIEEGNISNEMMLTVDRHGDNALHHALRNGFEDVGVQLLDVEPQLAEQVNKIKESPLHMACRSGYLKVVKKLMQIPSSAHIGPKNATALDAAIKSGNIDVVKELLKWRPELAYIKNGAGNAALSTAVGAEKLEIVKILLEHDPHQAYIQSESTNSTPFLLASWRGFVTIAEEIRRHCPDSVYSTRHYSGYNALHEAVEFERQEFIDYVIRTPELHRLINQGGICGGLPLHCAASRCNPKALRSLISHKAQDYSAVNCELRNALDVFYDRTDYFKTLKWTEAFTLLSSIIPSSIVNFLASDKATKELTKKAEKEIKWLTQTHTTNTSLVAALLATITFAAAFTLPGGYSTDSSDTGLPIFARKTAFQVFLVSDTIAMCTSLAVAFLCVLATWEDLDLLLNYRKYTRLLMWCAYATTAVAFATGLYTVIAPNSLWLAVLILVLTSLLPLLSKLIGEWPMVKLRFRLGHNYRPTLIAMIKDAI
ncbi:hypothetical protein LUZ60_005218 [Juncus effusus]|nr:hypothetical protein LUZ60_005218 [Juncus effusus]